MYKRNVRRWRSNNRSADHTNKNVLPLSTFEAPNQSYVPRKRKLQRSRILIGNRGTSDVKVKKQGDTDEDQIGDVKTIPSSFWAKLKHFTKTKIPVICKLYNKHQSVIENLIAVTLDVGGLAAHNALKSYCNKKRLEAGDNGEIIDDKKPNSLSKVLSWINKKLKSWATGSNGPDINEPTSLIDKKQRDLVFYPEKLNLVLFPPSMSNVHHVLDEQDDEEEVKQELTAEEVREELWEQLQELSLTTTNPTVVKTKRSCHGSDCVSENMPDLEGNVASKDQLKELNDIDEVMNSFDRSPINLMMESSNGQSRGESRRKESLVGEKNSVLKEPEEPELSENTYLKRHRKLSSANKNFPISSHNWDISKENGLLRKTPREDNNSHNSPIELISNDEIQSIESISRKNKIFNNRESEIDDYLRHKKKSLDGIANEEKSSEYGEIKPTAQSVENVTEYSFLAYEKEHSLPPLIGKNFTSGFDVHKSNAEIGRNMTFNMNDMMIKAIYFGLMLALFSVLVCLCGYLWHRRKERKKYNLSDSEAILIKKRSEAEPIPYNSMTDDSDFEVNENTEYYGDPKWRYPTLKEKGDRKSRKQSHKDDYVPIGPKKRKTKRFLWKSSTYPKPVEREPLVPQDIIEPKWKDSGTLANMEDD